MRKLSRLHVAVALLAVLSVVSLLGASLVVTQAVPAGYTSIFATKPVETNVWWEQNPYGWYGSGEWSGQYSSWGRTYIHLMVSATGIGTEEVEVRMYGLLYDAAGTSYTYFEVWSWTLTSGYNTVDYQMLVPSKKFMFWTYGPSYSEVSLSFYLSGS